MSGSHSDALHWASLSNDEKATRAEAFISELLDRFEESGGPDEWEADCLNDAIQALSIKFYTLAYVDAIKALVPPNERSTTYKAQSGFTQLSLDRLRANLERACAKRLLG